MTKLNNYLDAWIAKNGPEHQLPGLDFTPNQMFWVSAANVWCAKYRPQVKNEKDSIFLFLAVQKPKFKISS